MPNAFANICQKEEEEEEKKKRKNRRGGGGRCEWGWGGGGDSVGVEKDLPLSFPEQGSARNVHWLADRNTNFQGVREADGSKLIHALASVARDEPCSRLGLKNQLPTGHFLYLGPVSFC